jgi:hypothetical protein
MDKRQSIGMSSNYCKKTRLNSDEDQCEDQCEVHKEEESERFEMSFQSLTIKLEDLPDELILKVFSYLENTADRIRSGHLSQRLRAISSDESLWQKRIHSKKLYPHRDRFSNLYWIEEM